ncbi:hypothetical protein C8A05DRAFT_18732 [Staphylotrichum tortipilum]|uniref:Ankyrin repeat domain-containing protein n=1 Tax=Staphylotrichum tortipilum TaxID=2831512 RepID=A0AAN6MDZ0_9PEZI|nr:hypothetical protein C8A05DRAFT_18732 [Staphylotrichum longicolle]
MPATQQESHEISVLAGQGETAKLATLVRKIAERECASPGEILMACKDDFQQTAAHIAAAAGQTRSIETLAELLGTKDNRAAYFSMANRFSGDYPVHSAMRHGFLGAFKALVASGADPTVKNRFGDMVVDYLGDFEQEEVLRVVEEHQGAVMPELRARLGLSTGTK